MEYFRNKRQGLLKTIKCDCCGNKFIPGNDATGLPNGVGFVHDGGVVNICRICMMNKSKLNQFLNEKGVDVDGKNNNDKSDK